MWTNKNRTINIYKTGGDPKNDSWRYNFSKIASSVDDNYPHSEFITQVKDFSKNYNVDGCIDLLMDSELPKFQTTNEWASPMKKIVESLNSGGAVDKINGVVTIFKGVQQIANGQWTDSTGVTTGTFQPWVKNIKAWNGAQTFGCELSFNFAMGQYGLWNAREEVVKPILNLIIPTIPQHLNAFTISGPAPNSFNLISEMILSAGRTIFKEHGDNDEWKAVKTKWDNLVGSESDADNIFEMVLTKIGEVGDVIGTLLEFLVLGAYKRFTYTIDFGNMFSFNRMLPTKSSWNFSKEVDQYGLPVAGDVKITYESMIPMSLSSSTLNNMSMRYKFNE